MLYDIKEDGQRVYALALVQAIYRWQDEVCNARGWETQQPNRSLRRRHLISKQCGALGGPPYPSAPTIPPCHPTPPQVWMEHRYLLTRQDLLERPSWAAALQV